MGKIPDAESDKVSGIALSSPIIKVLGADAQWGIAWFGSCFGVVEGALLVLVDECTKWIMYSLLSEGCRRVFRRERESCSSCPE